MSQFHLIQILQSFTKEEEDQILRQPRRSKNNTKITSNASTEEDYKFLDDVDRSVLPDFLIAHIIDETKIEFWTKNFIGPTISDSKKIIHLNTYFILNRTFQYNINLYPDKLYNLMGKIIKLGTFDYRPFIVATKNNSANVLEIINATERQPLFLDGTEARFLLYFCGRHNCTVEVYIEESKDWGTAYWNMSGVGLLGALNKGKCEIAIDALYLWHREYLHFDISMPLSRSGVTNIVPVPLQKIPFFLPLQPFSWQLWIALLFCLIIEFLSLFLSYSHQSNERSNQIKKESFIYGFSVTLRIFLSQGFNETHTDLISRTILFSCLIINLVIDAVYEGGLASILTLPIFQDPTDTIERLAQHNMIWTGTAENWIFSMEKSEDPLIRKVIQLYEIDSMENLKKRSLNENIGFVIERLPFGHYSIPEYISREAAQRYHVMKEDLYYEYCVAFVPKLWPYLENFDKLILALHASGLLEYWEWDNTRKYLDNYIQDVLRENKSLDDGSIRTLNIQNLIGIILIWIVGILFSFFIFIFEIFYKKK
ncbi:ionotropic receptor 21a-like [Condylostylus longicornis]|uniref:ionotropic receptor 21a-like n=1 Tax=Condylostylus longicornis TaxID=2530218 RepID=UPI00244DE13A|nr:ionotropic receptor 21a-like [Condylostylus longicornis]